LVKLYSYNKYSVGAKLLAQALGIKRIKHKGSRYNPKFNDVIINWGSSELPKVLYKANNIINAPWAIKNASNKYVAFEVLSAAGVPVPPYTTDKELVDFKVVVRHKLNGKGGDGIEIIKDGDLPDAPLYVKYIPKKDEYRVHILDGKVIDVQKKKRKLDVPNDEVNWEIRNLAGGFIFARDGVELTPELEKIAVDAVDALDLVFGAVDIIYNEYSNKYYVLEVNTAPGLMGSTLDKYVEAFNKYLL